MWLNSRFKRKIKHKLYPKKKKELEIIIEKGKIKVYKLKDW
jgi:hypothetical protein